VLELVEALATHAVAFVTRAGMLRPGMAASATVTEGGEAPCELSSFSPTLKESRHGFRMPDRNVLNCRRQ
jgi:hypothetical protein